MKRYLFIVLLFYCFTGQAQTITGKVIDKNTRLPLAAIFVAGASGSAFTNHNGVFSLKITAPFDTVRIKSMGYKPFKLAASEWGTALKTIALEPQYIQLGEVRITAKKNYYKDSVNLRQEFAKQFNFRGPRFNEIFISPSPYVPFAVVSINVTMLYRALTKKHTPEYKLQQVLLRDEKENHVSARFNKTMVADITHLQGDSLENFMSAYRPTPALLDKLADYDLIRYIKTSLDSFKTKRSQLNALPVLLKPGQSLEE